MSDLNVMLREHARTSLQTQLDTAVTNGDTEAARKVAADLAKLDVATAPKALPYGDVEIKAALEKKADWWGVDPRKSGAATRLGKDMSPAKFATAEAFAEALIKAVEEEFKPAVVAKPEEETEEEIEEETEEEIEEDGTKKKPVAKTRSSDGPSDRDTGGARSRRTSGPWTKLSDAPAEVQADIKRTADKFAPKTEDGRKKYMQKALESHYQMHQRKKGK